MTHKGTITLETDRLILRRFTTEDAEPMFRNWANDPEAARFMTWQPHTDISETEGILREWIARYDKPDYYHWAIIPKDLGELIGSIGAEQQNDETKMVHMGYCIGKLWWRQGYTSEALTRLVRFFFEEVCVNRIESIHDLCNPNSGKVMLKAGLQYEGTKRQAGYGKQGVYDFAMYAVLAEDYFSGSKGCNKLTIGDISIDAANPEKLREFYATLTGWEQHTLYNCPALIADNGLVILFMGCDFDYISPVWPEKPGEQQKQTHFNFQVDDLPTAVGEAIRLGATKAAAQYGGDHFTTMFDPEGHPFCLCRR